MISQHPNCDFFSLSNWQESVFFKSLHHNFRSKYIQQQLTGYSNCYPSYLNMKTLTLISKDLKCGRARGANKDRKVHLGVLSGNMPQMICCTN
jgi:hypothetical protein